MFSGETILRGDLVVDIENGGYSSILVVACGLWTAIDLSHTMDVGRYYWACKMPGRQSTGVTVLKKTHERAEHEIGSYFDARAIG
jgi:hypothetical protein